VEDNLRAIDEAAACGAPVLVLVCGAVPGQSLAESRKQIAEGISECVGHARAAGVKLAIEPLHPMYAGDRSAVVTVGQANDLCEVLGSPAEVGIAVDVYHTWWDAALEVEIARAGEAGAGFAVVAEEVRSLALRSATAAKETASKIEAAIASSRTGSATCRSGSSNCTRVGESLREIADKIAATDGLVADIAAAAGEQATGIDQINRAILQMEKVTQGNAAGAEESASAAEELAAHAESLNDLVGTLRRLTGDGSSVG
jgi:hypothetical protein